MNLRLFCATAAMCLLASTGSAQQSGARPVPPPPPDPPASPGMRLPSASLPDRTPTNPTPSTTMLPSASLPPRTQTNPIPGPMRLPSASLPHEGRDLYGARPRDYSPDFGRGRRRHPRGLVYGYGYPPYFVASPEPRDTAPGEVASSGYLHLQMQPGSAQVYVDGFYMGSADDFRRLIPGRSIEAGAHRVEVRAPGYETAAFDVMIPPNETVTYRTDLRPEAGSVKVVAPVPGPPKTFYVIPGCYAGDRPPQARLPRGCDRSKLRRIPPQPVLSARR